MFEDRLTERFRPGQRWCFYTGLDEFQRELVILGTGRSAGGGTFFEVAVPFAPHWDGAPRGLDGAALAVGAEGLEASAVELVEEDLASSDVRRDMRIARQIHFTAGTVDDGLREYLAGVQWEAAQAREAGAQGLLRAIGDGDLDEARRLIEDRPALLDAPPGPGRPETPLCLAVEEGKTGFVAMLLDLGADPNARGAEGMTPLHYAARYGRPEAAKLLLAHGADAGAADAAGVTPMLAAARSPCPDAARVAQVLEDDGAAVDLNALVRLGRTAEAVRRLEADPHACAAAPFPHQLLEDAVAAMRLAVLRRSDPGIEDRELTGEVLAEHLPLLERLLAQGMDPNAGSALWEAVQMADPRPARLLLERGADPNKDLARGRFLPEAARSEEVRDLLLEHGARGRGHPEVVIARETEALAADPEDAEALGRRAAAWQRLGRFAEALADWEQAILLAPEDPQGYAARAWIWATCPEDRLRDGPAAVASARRAVELDGGAAVLWDAEAGRAYVRCEYRETLAAALAECGDFEAAAAAIDEALATASPHDRPRLLYRRKLFVDRNPYRDVPGADDPALYSQFAAEAATKKPGIGERLAGLLGRLWRGK